MSNEPIKTSKRALDPMDRVSEVLFGLIMVLTKAMAYATISPDRPFFITRTVSSGAKLCRMDSITIRRQPGEWSGWRFLEGGSS
jgi:hypothetical protein